MSDRPFGHAGMLHGMPIYLDSQMGERVQHSRSPARAKRRAARGYPQHHVWRPSTKVIVLPRNSGFVMHPALYADMKRKL
jgi:hypothetical protein